MERGAQRVGRLALQSAFAGRAVNDLPVAGFVASNAFWVGLHPALSAAHIAYTIVV